MTLTAVFFILLGLAASWAAGRFVKTNAALVQGGAVGICGVAALFLGMGELMETGFLWALGGLLIYGTVGAMLFKNGQAARERAE